MRQKHLWEDGFSVLWKTKTGAVGKTRLKRYLIWMDALGNDWTKPDLDAYAKHLRDERNLNESTVYHTIADLRNHYLAVLSNPDHYPHIPKKKCPRWVNEILECLGYNTATINYHSLTSEDPSIGSENLQIVLPPTASINRDSILKNFVYWLDETGRHWTQPDLIYYKLVLQEESRDSADYLKNALTSIRKRYAELVEDEDVMATLTEEKRAEFLRDFRKLLAYVDEYPTRSEATREMLENDPYNQSWLTRTQVEELLSLPDVTTFVGVRDRALLGLALASGIQQYEVTKIQVDDLYGEYEGEPALRIGKGKTRGERCVPYDDYQFVLGWIEEWLQLAEITEGPVFRGTYGNRDVLRPHGIAPETVSDIIARYPVSINNNTIHLLFSDLRATAGRRWYDNGVSIEEVERRLGLTYRRSTLGLIGLRLRPEFT